MKDLKAFKSYILNCELFFKWTDDIKVVHVYLVQIAYNLLMFNSDRTGNYSVRRKFIRTYFLFIDNKGRQCLHKIGAIDFKLASKLFLQNSTFLCVDDIQCDFMRKKK